MTTASTPNDLHRRANALTQVHAAKEQRDIAQEIFYTKVRDAWAIGATMKDIAMAADITRQRVWQIIHSLDED